MTKRNKAPPTWRKSLPTIESVTIVGLGGIGRQVAVQLAALGVPRLQLVDARTVARSTHAAEGYPFEDVGRLRVHSSAYLCHQINPRLNIHASPTRSLGTIEPGGAVFCCSATPAVWPSLQRPVRPNVVVARCDVFGNKLQLDFARGVSVVAEWLDRMATSPVDQRPARRGVTPIYFATLAAGLLVAEFIRFCQGRPSWRSVRLDLQSLQSKVDQPG
ncbi:MAG: ThiF family adenylyltransferase [Planctomycetes bacterium]|nr:ThiF family adenylyltransferase [Planctomycetota bacterium]